MRERWTALRNRVLSSPAFQRWAASFPLTRPVARARAGALFDLTAGFVYAQTAYACVTLGVLDRLVEGPLTTATLAVAIELPEAGAARLLRAAAGLGLVEPLGDRWTLGETGASLLGAPGVAAMIAHHRLLYADLADPVALLRRGGGGGALSSYWPYAEGREGEAAPYSRLMSASQAMVAAQVLDAWPALGSAGRLLDVGGGDGTFLRAVAARHPRLALSLFDLPPVAETASAAFAAAGVSAEVHGGDLFADPLPRGADVISLVRVLHDHDDAPALAILRAARAALPPRGMLLVAEPMAETLGAEGVGTYFEMYLLAMGSGRPRTAGELRAMLTEAGFRGARRVGTGMPLIASLIVANA